MCEFHPSIRGIGIVPDGAAMRGGRLQQRARRLPKEHLFGEDCPLRQSRWLFPVFDEDRLLVR